jgi:hypothetical protein
MSDLPGGSAESVRRLGAVDFIHLRWLWCNPRLDLLIDDDDDDISRWLFRVAGPVQSHS